MRKFLLKLPDVKGLKKLSQSLAMLDAIISPEWEYRYYSFDSKWSENEMTASMRNGSGDDYFILFNEHGAIIKGFAHEFPMSPYAVEPKKVWQGIFESVPQEFASFLSEPAFSIEDTTFCIWRKNNDLTWQIGETDYPQTANADGLADLLYILDGNPQTYQEFAEEYYEVEIEISDIKEIYKHKPLSETLVKNLNKEVSLEDLQRDGEEIGYPGSK